MLPCCFLQVLLPDLLQALLHLMLPVLPLQVLVFLLQVQVLVRLMLPVLQVPVPVLVLLLPAPVQAFLPARFKRGGRSLLRQNESGRMHQAARRAGKPDPAQGPGKARTSGPAGRRCGPPLAASRPVPGSATAAGRPAGSALSGGSLRHKARQRRRTRHHGGSGAGKRERPGGRGG